MPAETTRKFEALEVQAASLMEIFTNAGFEPVAPSILQPAEIFLNEVGEALRGRTYVFTDPSGEELCLRPDLTVPACRLYLERHPEAGATARYCYNGPTFRYQPSGASVTRPREFRQAGIELFGSNEKEKAETEIVALAIEAVKSAGIENFTLELGDLSLFYALLDVLDIPQRWRDRLKHHFWRPKAFHELLWSLCEKQQADLPADLNELISELDPANLEEAEERVAAYMEESDIPLIGARSLTEITSGLIGVAADKKEEPVVKETAELIESYLSISGPPKAAGARITDLLGSLDLNLGAAMKSYTRRLDLFAKAGIDLTQAHFSAVFGRDLEYYTGFVFQIEIPGMDIAGQIAGGGRYDGLMHRIGAPKDVTAVGVAIHTERLLVAARGETA